LVRRTRAGDLGWVLHGLHERDRVGTAVDAPTGGLDAPDQRRGTCRGVDPGLEAVPPELFEGLLKGRQVGEGGEIADRIARLVGDLHGIEIESGQAVPGDDRVTERQRRVADIAAPQVECPGEVVRVRHHEGIDPALGHLLPDAVELGMRRLSGEAARMRPDRLTGWFRPIDPDHVHEVHVDGAELTASLRDGCLETLEALARVQPGIIRQDAARGEVRGDPIFRARRGEGHRGDDARVHLLGGLDRVAPVHHERRLVGEDHRGAGRSGEPCQPGQAFGALGDVLALMLVRTRHDEACKAAAREFGPQPGDMLRTLSRGGRVVESLEVSHGNRVIWWGPSG
jgi:hypothetical protein